MHFDEFYQTVKFYSVKSEETNHCTSDGSSEQINRCHSLFPLDFKKIAYLM